jgi:hypothetical protein
MTPRKPQEEQEERKQKAPPPPSFTCPLSGEVIEDPVMDSCAHNFERKAICDWLEHHSCCPISRKTLSEADLVPNHILAERIDRWKWRNEHDGIMLDEDPTCSSSDDEETLRKQQLEVAVETDLDGMERGVRSKRGPRRGSRRHRKKVYNEIPSEFMLLPQERRVLAIVRCKAEESRLKLQRKRCCQTIAGVIITSIAILFILSVLSYLQTKRGGDE